MKEVKENLIKTVNQTCEWIQKELSKQHMSPGVVDAIPETLKALSTLTDTVLRIREF